MRKRSISAVAVMLALATTAGAGTIDFDFDAFGAPINAPIRFIDTTHLTELYAPLGVHFSGPGGNDGGAILNEGSNFGPLAHSHPNFLAFNRLVDANGTPLATMADGGHPLDPETITFDIPQGFVSIYAAPGSFDGGENGIGSFRMDAFDMFGNLLGTSSNSMVTGWHQLSFSSTVGIASVVLTETSGNPLFVFDDLSFRLVPEPGSLALVVIGASLLAVNRRRRRTLLDEETR